MEIIKTNIEGLDIRINKVIKDERGFLTQIPNSVSDDPFLKAGIKNIYVSVAQKKFVARAGHYHNKNIENFFAISGTSLWLFIDCRKESPTFNNFYTVILGSKKPSLESGTPFYTIDESQMAQVLVPSGVYHVFWPLTDEDVTILALASETYDEKDYGRPDLNNYSQIKPHLAKFGINV